MIAVATVVVLRSSDVRFAIAASAARSAAPRVVATGSTSGTAETFDPVQKLEMDGDVGSEGTVYVDVLNLPKEKNTPL